MGGAGIGVYDMLVLNAANPAATHIQGVTTISLSFQYESIKSENDISSVNTRNGDPIGFQFSFPVKKSLNFMVALRPIISSRYYYEKMVQNDDIEYSRTVEGSGGLNSMQLGANFTLNSWLRLGGSMHFNFGSYDEMWDTEIFIDEYRETEDKLTSNLNGIGFELGSLFLLTKDLKIGVVYNTSSKLDGEYKVESNNSYVSEPTSLSIKYPQSLGIGFSYTRSRMLVALDYYSQFWSQYELNGNKDESYNNLWRLGGGLEYTGSKKINASYGNRMSWRVGAYYSQLPYTDNGMTDITEKFITAGISLPFVKNIGRVDLALEVGQRGNLSDNLYKETIVRFRSTITGSERWFTNRIN